MQEDVEDQIERSAYYHFVQLYIEFTQAPVRSYHSECDMLMPWLWWTESCSRWEFWDPRFAGCLILWRVCRMYEEWNFVQVLKLSVAQFVFASICLQPAPIFLANQSFCRFPKYALDRVKAEQPEGVVSWRHPDGFSVSSHFHVDLIFKSLMTNEVLDRLCRSWEKTWCLVAKRTSYVIWARYWTSCKKQTHSLLCRMMRST